MNSSVLIVGAGPTGLTLAAELSRAGVSCRVIEQRAEPSQHSRAFGLQPRVLEILYTRCRANDFISRGITSSEVSLGKEGFMDMRQLAIKFPHMLIIPQVDTEQLLEQWAIEQGVVIERGLRVAGISQTAEEVTATVVDEEGNKHKEIAAYVVGCDGSDSTVRKSLGIDFPGFTHDFSAVIADVRLRSAPPEQVFARHSDRGMVAVMPFPDGSYRLTIQDHEHMHTPVDEPVTFTEIERSSKEILGVDLGIEEALWLSRFRSDQRLADNYRSGRVFLAGDAAHVHTPAGGQGLNLGIQDAVNLGWKIAGVINGWAPPELLDTYEEELRPNAAKTLRETEMVFRFNTGTTQFFRFIRWLAKKMLSIPAAQRRALLQISGTDTRYKTKPAGPRNKLLGHRLNDIQVLTEDSRTAHLFDLFEPNRFILVDSTEDRLFASVVADRWRSRITLAYGGSRTAKIPAAVLVRPDGYVTFTARGKHDVPALDKHLSSLFSSRVEHA